MTSTTQSAPKLIHIARILAHTGIPRYIFLRKLESNRFTWFQEREETEVEEIVSAQTVEEALRLASRFWKERSFRFLMCGFRYTLPERDEHGINALFHQMCASYSSMNGIYYDEELGNNCFVQNASNEALEIWKRLKDQKRL
jgi:hypothetical protein